MVNDRPNLNIVWSSLIHKVMWRLIYGCLYNGLFTKHIFGTLLHLRRKMWRLVG